MLSFKEFIVEVRLVNMTNREIVKHLQNLGWTLARHKGDHEVYEHPNSTKKISVPKHRGTNAPGTTKSIMTDSTTFDKKNQAA